MISSLKVESTYGVFMLAAWSMAYVLLHLIERVCEVAVLVSMGRVFLIRGKVWV